MYAMFTFTQRATYSLPSKLSLTSAVSTNDDDEDDDDDRDD